jgi:hypothetical protein
MSATWKMGASASFRGEESQRSGALEGQEERRFVERSLVGSVEGKRRTHLVDRNNRLRVLHTSKMLNRSRDTDRNVKIRRNDLTRLSNLQRVVGVPRIDSSTGSTDGGTESVSEGNDGLVEGALGLDTATAGDD